MIASAARTAASSSRRFWRCLRRILRCTGPSLFCSATSVTLGKTGPDSEQFDPGEFFDGDLLDTPGWRLMCLLGAGWSFDAATDLASRPHHEVDLHQAIDLLENGCDEATALAILL